MKIALECNLASHREQMAGTVEDMTLGYSFKANTDFDADAAAAAGMGHPHIGVTAPSVLYMMK